jgi:hypothetical protein
MEATTLAVDPPMLKPSIELHLPQKCRNSLITSIYSKATTSAPSEYAHPRMPTSDLRDLLHISS